MVLRPLSEPTRVGSDGQIRFLAFDAHAGRPVPDSFTRLVQYRNDGRSSSQKKSQVAPIRTTVWKEDDLRLFSLSRPQQKRKTRPGLTVGKLTYAVGRLPFGSCRKPAVISRLKITTTCRRRALTPETTSRRKRITGDDYINLCILGAKMSSISPS